MLCYLAVFHLIYKLVFVQEVRTAAEAALKELAGKEKEEVGLQERKKHATTKAKKLKKSLTDVSNSYSFMSIKYVNLCF